MGNEVFIAVSAALASGVEFVEALTIVLAVGITKTWRDALEGTAAAALALVLMVAIVAAGLLRYVTLSQLQLVIGVLLLLFGLKWLRKALLRYSGLKALRNEDDEFQEEIERIRDAKHSGKGRDWFGVTTAFNGVFLEGTEVVFIVLALGAGSQKGSNSMAAAIIGAVIAAVTVIAVGVVAHRPLNRVPENTMKFVVGIMLTSFGTLWTGEGLKVTFLSSKNDPLNLAVLIAGYLLVSWIVVSVLKARVNKPVASVTG